MYQLEYGEHWKFRHVNPGSIFRLPGGALALMTEYGDNEGHRHAYLLESGESCWTDMDTVVIVLDLVPDDITEYLTPTDAGEIHLVPAED